jgi:hypothetical protein
MDDGGFKPDAVDESVVAMQDVELADEPIPMVDEEMSNIDGHDRSATGSVVEFATDEIRIAVKKARKRKRDKPDRSIEISSNEVMDQDTSGLVVDKRECIEQAVVASGPSGELPDWLITPPELTGQLSSKLRGLIVSCFNQERTEQDLISYHSNKDDFAQEQIDLPPEETEIPEENPQEYDDEILIEDEIVPVQEDDRVDEAQQRFEEDFISAFPSEESRDPIGTQDDKSVEGNEESYTSNWSERTRKTCLLLSGKLQESDAEISLQSFLEGKSRSAAASLFLETLILKTHDYIELEQREPYADILIRRAAKFADGAAMACAVTG